MPEAMATRRRNRGFERGGSFPASHLGVSRRHSRELELSRGWIDLVGEQLATRVRPVSLVRGVVEYRLGNLDAVEREALLERLPRLTGELAARLSRLTIRRWRLIEADGARGPSRAAVDCAPREAREPAARSPGPTGRERRIAGLHDGAAAAPPGGEEVECRLDRLMERYLARRSDQKP